MARAEEIALADHPSRQVAVLCMLATRYRDLLDDVQGATRCFERACGIATSALEWVAVAAVSARALGDIAGARAFLQLAEEATCEREDRAATVAGYSVLGDPATDGEAVRNLNALVAWHNPADVFAVLNAIDRAFDAVPPPGVDGTTIRQAEALDDYRRIGREGDFLRRWQEIPDEELMACPCALSYLDDQGMHYYLPALMTLALRTLSDPERVAELGSSYPLWSLEYTLNVRGGSAGHSEYAACRFRRLDAAQRLATARFVAWYCDDEATRIQWEELVAAEANGPRADWWQVLVGLAT